jgi:hypothetical protein
LLNQRGIGKIRIRGGIGAIPDHGKPPTGVEVVGDDGQGVAVVFGGVGFAAEEVVVNILDGDKVENAAGIGLG